MKKYLIEIAYVVDYDKETEIDSFAVNSLDVIYNIFIVMVKNQIYKKSLTVKLLLPHFLKNVIVMCLNFIQLLAILIKKN